MECRTATIIATRNLCRVEYAIEVFVLYIVNGIDMEISISTCYGVGRTSRHRTIYKEVVGDVGIRCALRVATHEIATILPVVNDVVHILIFALHLVVTSAVVAIKVAI